MACQSQQLACERAPRARRCTASYRGGGARPAGHAARLRVGVTGGGTCRTRREAWRHDAGEYDLPIPAGAVFTVEPGVYLPERGFGVRIEDEVLFLGDGKWRLLTADFPRKLEDVEAWVARARR